MYIIGLTGGIASGKSSVAAWLRERGLDVYDADREIHALYADPAVRELIAEQFGARYAGADTASRREIGNLVFADPNALRRLENILYPALNANWRAAVAETAKKGAAVLFYDVPLLYEKNLAGNVDAVWVVYATPAQQLRRAMERSGLTAAEVKSRMAAQMPLDDKIWRADAVVWNDGAWEETAAQLAKLLTSLPSGV
ncbi:MAG: dephospho-CoA kinase [Gracilibacteraceae bacterium]|jgi:dephospho-CoA kinase|nr:dephospho-CoA kinase [Gracilibacteraceae bacterium]